MGFSLIEEKEMVKTEIDTNSEKDTSLKKVADALTQTEEHTDEIRNLHDSLGRLRDMLWTEQTKHGVETRKFQETSLTLQKMKQSNKRKLDEKERVIKKLDNKLETLKSRLEEKTYLLETYRTNLPVSITTMNNNDKKSASFDREK